MTRSITFDVPRRLDLATGNDLQSRMRSALRNGITDISLRFDPACALCSSEFLGWLVACAKQSKSQGGTITLRGLSADNRRILAMTRLDADLRLEEGS